MAVRSQLQLPVCEGGFFEYEDVTENWPNLPAEVETSAPLRQGPMMAARCGVGREYLAENIERPV